MSHEFIRFDLFVIMVAFSKFLTGKRGSRQLLDTDGFTYNQRKDRTTSDGLTRCLINLMNCFFHLCQSVQRCIQKSFKVKCRTDKSFALASRLVVFLAFVPLEHIESAFEALSVHVAGTYPELMAIVN